MAGLADIFGGGTGAFGAGGLYGDLLTPEQKQTLAYRGLMAAAGALADAAMPSRMPIPIGVGLGKAAAAMGEAQDTAGLSALRAALIGQQGQKLKSEMEARKSLAGKLGLLDQYFAGQTGGGGASSTSPAAAAIAALPEGSTDTQPTAAAPRVQAGSPLGGGLAAGGALTADPLALIEQYESGGRNIMQQAVPPGGGYNPSVGRVTGPSTAQGYYQITNSTWRDAAPKAGVDLEQYPTAMSAPKEVQTKVAQALFDERGFSPWAPYNPRLAAAISGSVGAPAGPSTSTTSPGATFGSLAPTSSGYDPRLAQILASIGSAAQLSGLGDVVAPYEKFLYNSPGYKGAVAGAEKWAGVQPELYTRWNSPEWSPELRARIETALNVPKLQFEAGKADIDRETTRQSQVGAAKLEITPVPRLGPGGIIVETPATRYDAAIAAGGGAPTTTTAPAPATPGDTQVTAPERATNTPVLGKPQMGSIPPGYEVRVSPEGNYVLAPTTGGPAAQAEEEKEKAKKQSADIVTQDIERALKLSNGWTTGAVGSVAQTFPGTEAYNLNQLLLGIKGNVGIDRLQQMRQQSPTGGALGNVTEQENQILQSTLGSLAQSQNKDQFEFNLRRLHNVYQDAVNGSPEKLETAVRAGRITPAQRDAALAKRYDLSQTTGELPKGVPAGSRQIGTTKDGKPVFEVPQPDGSVKRQVLQ